MQGVEPMTRQTRTAAITTEPQRFTYINYQLSTINYFKYLARMTINYQLLQVLGAHVRGANRVRIPDPRAESGGHATPRTT